MPQLPTIVRNGLESLGLVPPPDEGAAPSDDGAPPVLDRMISRDPTIVLSPAYMDVLKVNEDSILTREGGQDLTLFDRLLDDDVAMSCLQQRRLAITAKDWEVTPGDENDPRSVKAGEDFKEMLDGVGFDRVTTLLHFAVWFGYAVGEAMWTTKVKNGRRLIWLDDVVVPDRRWFGFTHTGELRIAAMLGGFGGEALPPNKFFSIRTGGTHDFAFYGLGLAHWVYWPVWFKRAGTRFWALLLEKLADPTRIAEFPDGMPESEKAKLLSSLVAIGSDSAVHVPQGVASTVQFMEAQRAVGGSPYKDFITEQNESMMRLILGQPGTSKATPQGVGGKQSEVHEDVKDELVKADADLICETINRTVATWVTRWNYGPDVVPPRVYRILDDPVDLNTVAERDVQLKTLGWERTEESFGQVYGDGYEYKEPPPPPPAFSPGNPANNNDPAQIRADQARKRAEFDAQNPRPLYVQRRLQNVGAFKKWAEGQGFKDVVPDLHVTVLYSRTPVDWFAMGEAWTGGPDGTLKVPPGGPRTVEALGDKGAVVLRFASSELAWRHDAMLGNGASHDFDEFVPHVTITYDGSGVDLSKVEPFTGELVFGPELFEEIDPEPLPGMTPVFSAAEEEAIDALTARLMDETNPIILEFASSIRSELAKAKELADGNLSVDGARVALLQAFEQFDPNKLAKTLGLSFLATRVAAEDDAEDQVI
jgi:phage gp29-like protein